MLKPCLQEEAIRTHNSDALVVGAPPQDAAQDSEEEGASSSCSLLQPVSQLLASPLYHSRVLMKQFQDNEASAVGHALYSAWCNMQ
jgi:hypothetical protein